MLDRVHRFGGGIARLAAAIRAGDGDAVMDLLRAGADDVVWLDGDVAEQDALPAVSEPALAAARATIEAARAGRAREALDALGSFRILCAHRRGPYGVATWTARMEGWLAAELAGLDPEDRWYVGRPLLVNENDYELRLNNGDTGVVVAREDGSVAAAFARGEETIEHSPSRLGAVDTVYAMTVHKSQGSQFASAAVLLPSARSHGSSRASCSTPRPPEPSGGSSWPGPRRACARRCSARWPERRGWAGACGATWLHEPAAATRPRG